ncbi:MAG TPA: hypothetical protein VHD36_03170 [Pirellulales bacterium]|nr:hypothetical protein [Pirellulales bacterium]
MAGVLFPAGVLGLAVAMLVAHRASWQRAQARIRNAVDLAFRYSQFRRRMQSSSLLALIGPTMLVGMQLSPDRSPKLYVTLWLMVTLATCWIGWLAVVDAVASARHFRRLGRERAIARDGLKREFERIIAARTSADSDPTSTDFETPPSTEADRV